MIYDAIVIGGGIAGITSAYFLQKEGMSVLLLEKGEICKKGSFAAGAFLSPKIGKQSLYKDYVNKALEFSLNFYEKEFPSLLNRCGLLKLPYDEEDKKRLRAYEEFMKEIQWERRGEGYFFKNAAIIDPLDLCKAMTKNIKIIKIEAKNIEKREELFEVEGFKTKYLILSVGSEKIPLNIPYLKTKIICGYRYDARFQGDFNLKHNFHKRVSVSAFFKNRVAIGATHIKYRECFELLKTAKEDKYSLLEKAKEIMPLKDLKILKIYTGERLSTFDFFPIVGEVIDEKRTLCKYPYLKKGTKVPPSSFIYRKNLYLHTALGARGFVLAPSKAHLLAKAITKKKELPPFLSPYRQFIKYARKFPING